MAIKQASNHKRSIPSWNNYQSKCKILSGRKRLLFEVLHCCSSCLLLGFLLQITKKMLFQKNMVVIVSIDHYCDSLLFFKLRLLPKEAHRTLGNKNWVRF